MGPDFTGSIDPHETARFPRRRALAHWLLAIVVLAALATGLVGLAHTADSDPAKVAMVRVHMLIGILVAATLLFHLAVSYRDSRPPHLTSGNRLLDLLAKAVHQLLRLSIAALVVSGIVTVVKSGLPAVVFHGASDRVPAIVVRLPSFTAHAVIARFVLVLTVLHLLGACYHHVVRKDAVLKRIWPFGTKAGSQ